MGSEFGRLMLTLECMTRGPQVAAERGEMPRGAARDAMLAAYVSPPVRCAIVRA